MERIRWEGQNFPEVVAPQEEEAALLALLFNFPLEYAIRKIKDYHKLLKFNGTHQVLIYADDVNLGGKPYTP